MGKSTHHVPAPHTAQPVTRRRIETHHEDSQDEQNQRRRTTAPFEMIYSDLSGIAPIPSLAEASYYMSFIDDFTRLTWVVFLHEKSAAESAIRGFVAMVERQFEGQGIKHFFTDNGTEYVNH